MTSSETAPFILALDVGTLSVRAAIYDQSGKVQTEASKEIHLNRLNEVEIEQSPKEIISAIFEVMNRVLAEPVVQARSVAMAGLSTQRSSVVAWHQETGEPLSAVLSWQDRRAARYLKPLAKDASAIRAKSGLFLSPHYGASKLAWLLDHEPKMSHLHGSDQLNFGPLAAFIIYQIVEGNPCIVDHVNASRTQLMDLEERTWSAELLRKFNLSEAHLPRCQPTQSYFGKLAGTEIPLTAVNGDQNAAIYGLGPLEEGTFIVNVGTGGFVLLPTGNQPIHHPRLLASIANSSQERATYLLEGTVNGAGAALQWAADQWQMPDLVSHAEVWLAEVTEPPIFMNTIGGIGSPIWGDGPRPHFLSEGDVAEKTVAIIESIIFLIKINLEAMTNTGQDVKRIRISGGLSSLDGLCQLLADISQRLVVRADVRQSTSRGIAWLAADPAHSWNNLEDDYFLPKNNRPLKERYRTFCSQLGWS